MSRVDAVDVALTSMGTKVGVVSTMVTATNQKGEMNVSGLMLGGAQAVHGVVDLSTKGLQAVLSSTWGKAVPGLGGLLGVVGLYQGRNPQSNADCAGLVSNGLGVVASVTVFAGASPVIAGAATVGAVVAGGYQIYYTITDKSPTSTTSSPNYSLEGRNYQTPSYGLTPNYRGAGYVDPRILPTSSTLDQAKAQQAAQTKKAVSNAAQVAQAAAAAKTQAAKAAEINQQAQARLQRQEGAGSSSSISSSDLARANASSDPIGSLNDSQGWTGSSSSSPYGGPGSGTVWPIVIDLDGDGVELRPLSSSATFFDADSDTYLERTAWAGADDGILVIDLDGDGQVTQTKEIAFAEWTSEQDSDLQALAQVFDSNQGGVVDSQDARFGEFRIWKDGNSDAVVDDGEMMTLQEAGIQSMNLKTKDGTAVDLGDGGAANDRLFCLCA
jgi:hypothetical protein